MLKVRKISLKKGDMGVCLKREQLGFNEKDIRVKGGEIRVKGGGNFC